MSTSDTMVRGGILRSLIIPVYGNEENLPHLLAALRELDTTIDGLEVVFVVDGSPDRCHALLEAQLPDEPFTSQLIEHSRNFGSFTAVRTGMAHARGDHVAVLAADLQEPPELVATFFDLLDRGDADLVFGVRAARDDPWFTRVTSALFWRLYRRWVIPDMPAGGVDVFACTTAVRDAVLSLRAANSSLVAQLFYVGFRREFVEYERRERTDGASGWTVRKRLRYMADSVFAFSDLPILSLVWLGAGGVLFSAALGAVVLVSRLLGLIEVPGFATVVLAISLLFSLLLTTQGIIGMYLWRTFENTKGLPDGLVRGTRQYDGGTIP